MSVSLTLLPVALLMRVVMGKKGFDNFVKSRENRVKTDFSSKAELSGAVQKAGFDLIQYGGLLKTHLRGESDFFFWENVDGRWEAVFSIYDDSSLLSRFMDQVDRAAGRGMFHRNGVKIEAGSEAEAVPMRFPTNFNDAELLRKALLDFGARLEQTDAGDDTGDILCRIDKSQLRFTQRNGQAFYVEIRNAPRLEQAYQYLSDLDEDYRRCVQTGVYEKVKARAESQGMALESEEVLEDKTILMTLRVG